MLDAEDDRVALFKRPVGHVPEAVDGPLARADDEEDLLGPFEAEDVFDVRQDFVLFAPGGDGFAEGLESEIAEPDGLSNQPEFLVAFDAPDRFEQIGGVRRLHAGGEGREEGLVERGRHRRRTDETQALHPPVGQQLPDDGRILLAVGGGHRRLDAAAPPGEVDVFRVMRAKGHLPLELQEGVVGERGAPPVRDVTDRTALVVMPQRGEEQDIVAGPGHRLAQGAMPPVALLRRKTGLLGDHGAFPSSNCGIALDSGFG